VQIGALVRIAPFVVALAGACAGCSHHGPIDAACPGLPAAGQWQNISPPNSNYTKTYTGINAVVIRPDNPAIVYTTADMNGIFKSSDCGASWTLANSGKNGDALSTGRGWSMVIDPETPDIMYAVEGYGASGLWKSIDAGVDWQQMLTPEITKAFYSGGQITGISMDPTDHTHLVVESHGDCASGHACAAESTDSGASWKLIDLAPVGGWAESSAIAIVNHSTWLYCGLFSGLFRTADQGATWQTMQVMGALPSCNYYEPTLWQAKDQRYYLPAIAYTGPGLLQSSPNDTSAWTLVPDSPQAQVLIATENNLIATKSADSSYWIAAQSDPTRWKSFSGPPAGSPSVKGNIGGSAFFLAYEATHHVLYVSTMSTGLWQTVMQ
jgi:hypothetical protein